VFGFFMHSESKQSLREECIKKAIAALPQ